MDRKLVKVIYKCFDHYKDQYIKTWNTQTKDFAIDELTRLYMVKHPNRHITQNILDHIGNQLFDYYLSENGFLDLAYYERYIGIY